MLRLIGVLFIALLAQFLVHGWLRASSGLGQGSVDSWRESLNAEIEKDFPRE